MSKRILVPLDGSAMSKGALPWAFAMAGAMDADVELVNVHETAPALEYGAWNEDLVRGWATKYLAKVAEMIRSQTGRDVATTVLSGHAAARLTEYTAESGADLVVMATHGRGPLSRFWLGSVTDSIVRHTHLPVLVVRPQEPEEGGPEPLDLARTVRFESILVPLDGSKEAEAGLAAARKVAEPLGARFHLLRVFPYPEEFVSTYLPHTVQENARLLAEGKKEAQQYVDGVVNELRADGLEVDGHVLVDHSPGAGILHHARDHEIDVIAMATHGRGGVQRAILGSVTDKVVRASPVPVLVVRPD